MGDCQLRAVAWSPAVSHAGGVKSMPPLLHVFRPRALERFMRSFWVPVGPLPCLAFRPGPYKACMGAPREGSTQVVNHIRMYLRCSSMQP